MALPLLEGEVLDDGRDQEIATLRSQVTELRRELQSARSETSRVRRNADMALGNLRKLLAPLHSALCDVFGELDEIGTADTSQPVSGKTQAVWESWKTKMPGYPASFIDALLLHGELSAQALRVHMQCATQTVYDTATKLNKAGLLQKSNGKYRLKEIG